MHEPLLSGYTLPNSIRFKHSSHIHTYIYIHGEEDDDGLLRVTEARTGTLSYELIATK